MSHKRSRFDMNGWGIAAIVVGAIIVAGGVVAGPDALRYLRMRRM